MPRSLTLLITALTLVVAGLGIQRAVYDKSLPVDPSIAGAAAAVPSPSASVILAPGPTFIPATVPKGIPAIKPTRGGVPTFTEQDVIAFVNAHPGGSWQPGQPLPVIQ